MPTLTALLAIICIYELLKRAISRAITEGNVMQDQLSANAAVASRQEQDGQLSVDGTAEPGTWREGKQATHQEPNVLRVKVRQLHRLSVCST